MMALLALFPAALSATESVTSSAGGTGGQPYTIGCGTKAMVGVTGSIGRFFVLSVGVSVVGSIQAICVGLNADGSWNGTPASAPGIAGTFDPGDSVQLMCPQNQAVSGISGRSGVYVDQFRIHCAPLVEPGHLNGEGSLLAGDIGVTGGNLFGPFLCTSNKPGKGFTGKAGSFIDQLALICDYPSVAAPVAKTISLNSNSVVGGTTVNGTVTLNANALSGGTSVNLSRSVPTSASFQSNPITVPSGTKTATFSVNTHPVSSNVTNSISASPNTGSLSAAVLTIKEPSLKSVALSPTLTIPGGSVTGTVSLNGEAFSGGVAVNLSSSNTAAATVPSSVSIQNSTSANFPVTVSSGNQSNCSVIRATYNQKHQQAVLAIRIVNPAFGLTLAPGRVAGNVGFGSSSNATRKLSVESSDPALASVPSLITVPAGETSIDFTIGISSVPPGVSCAVITAADAAGNKNSLILRITQGGVTAID